MRIEQTLEPRQEYIDMQALQTQINTLDDKLDKVNGNVLELKGSIMSRAEAEAADNRRVSIERFEGEMGGMRDRIGKLEGGPQKLLGWISLFMSAGIGCMSLVLTGIGAITGLLAIIITVFLALLPHLH